ncbi:eukaryotic translation initiation factor 4E transporter-like isoform X2 [Vanessa atalanta]|uniref:eukaryotic translation initiation factor 4E transporter-like isoform X2 n=1 Tax=Vanessa atalanta TaxID=42275 RepID=UPI001FCD4B52|nr:eukaryotic translation initiation factor 4E transporter-like isoform X2 [Vanessa atalanta]
MVSKEVMSEVTKKGRRRRRRAGSRASKRRARKLAAMAVATPVEKSSPVKCAVHAFLLRYQSALRKVPMQLPPKVHAGPPSKRVKRVSWRHEDSGASGGGGDPAVLAVGPARRLLTYTRDELMRLRNSPLVRRGLENAFAGNETLALVLKRRSDSPNEEDKGGRGDAPTENHKGAYGRDRERRSADPRERVRKESEPSSGIVLSPQRRSFTSGCGAPAAAAPPPHLARTRPDSPLGAAAQPLPPKTEQAGRRIGSGRIMVRDVPSAAWEEGEPPRAEPYRPPPERRANGDQRYDRRSFNRDSYSSDIKRERDDRFNNEKQRDREDNRRGGRFSQRRFEKEDEPEWFSGGPTSQLETIELRGFDEPIKKNGSNNKENEKWSGGSRAEPSTPPLEAAQTLNNSNDKDSGVESKSEDQTQPDQPEFNLDEFLKFDSIPEVLTNCPQNGGSETEGSRFSRWFRRDSPPALAADRHYERLMHNMVDDLDSSTHEQPPVPEPQPAYPPVGARGNPPNAPAPSLLDMLRRASADTEQRAELNSGGGKIHSLEELESRLRPQPAAVHDHDLSAFKRLLAQVSGGHAVTAEPPRPQPPPQPMSLLQMLSKSMEQQQQQQQHQHQQQQHQQQQQQQQQQKAPHIPQELLYKLLQVQQRQQQTGEWAPTADRELLQRPEAQAIIHGLKAGEITVQHLMQQLGNPGLQSRHRELLLTILRTHQQRQQMGGSPLPPHLVVPPPHHQPLRLSPLPHSGGGEERYNSGVPARIPSPRELAAHTQSIMQGALIKKKLEEQRENYRRRHEMQQQQPKQPTPISFTPTSVLRKMTAEKEEAGSPKSWAAGAPGLAHAHAHAHAQALAKPHGRPIVKGNQSGTAPMGYAPAQPDYQQHYLNLQQQMANANRAFPHQQQQRQQVPNSLNGMGGVSRGGTTLHQLLVQSHQRTLNEMSGSGDNQLARWFSPELLARASAGKLPSVHVPNALSLEDLERHHHSPAPPVRN